MNKKGQLKEGFSPLTVTMLVILCVYVLILGILMLWMLMQIFKPDHLFMTNPLWFPAFEDFTFNNFRAVIAYTGERWANGKSVPMYEVIINSIIYAFGGSFVQTLSMCIMAYLAARYCYFYSKIIYTVVIVVMIVPIVGAEMSTLELLKSLNLYDTRLGFLVMKAAFVGIYFLVLYETFKAIPTTYSEAAMMDGAGDWYIMARICFPLVLNVVMTITLINFITFWNDYQTALLYMPSYPTLAYFLFTVQTYGTPVTVQGHPVNTITPTVKMTATFILMLPILLIFIFTNERLMGNLSIGGIKG